MRTWSLAMSYREKKRKKERKYIEEEKVFFNFSATTTTTSENGKTDTARPIPFSFRCAADVSFYFCRKKGENLTFIHIKSYSKHQCESHDRGKVVDTCTFGSAVVPAIYFLFTFRFEIMIKGAKQTKPFKLGAVKTSAMKQKRTTCMMWTNDNLIEQTQLINYTTSMHETKQKLKPSLLFFSFKGKRSKTNESWWV